MKNYIVVLPYSETSRLFHASKTVEQEAYVGENGAIVYYQSQAATFTQQGADKALSQYSDNRKAFIRELIQHPEPEIN